MKKKDNIKTSIFTIDLEDWFCVKGYEKYYEACDKDHVIQNLTDNTRTILGILKQNNVTGTFFVLGRLADMLPDLVAEVHEHGHEIACHGYEHKLLYSMSTKEFEQDLELSIKAIERACGAIPLGFRAPQFSINSNNLHLLDVLKDMGFLYDSSIFPISLHPSYGESNFPSKPFYHKNGLAEFPLATAKIAGINVPCAGGAYFRFYPYFLFKKLLVYCNLNSGTCVYYMHPWELSHTVPKSSMTKNLWFRQNYNISNTKNKLEKLIYDFTFTSVLKFLKEMKFNENGC